VDYTQPGWHQWLPPGDMRSRRWAVMVDSSGKGKRVLMPPVRERTQEAALRATRRGFPPVTEAMLNTYRVAPDMAAEQLLPQPDRIAPTQLDARGSLRRHRRRFLRLSLTLHRPRQFRENSASICCSSR